MKALELARSARAHASGFSPDLSTQKSLGQYFTTPELATRLARLALTESCRTVLDPMAGRGDLIEAALEVAIGRGQRLHVVAGVEIDPATALVCRRRLSGVLANRSEAEAHVRRGSAFDKDVLLRLPQQAFDLVITNPPFVRYQGEGAEGATAAGVRSQLIELASVLIHDAAEREVWAELIRGYSGQADLAVPSWLLSAMLVRPGGTLALVAPSAWKSRLYGDVVRYMLRRCFSEVNIIEDIEGPWFGSAQVRTSLVIARKHKSPKDALPLIDRGRRRVVGSMNQAVLLEGDQQAKWFRALEVAGETQRAIELPTALQALLGGRSLDWIQLEASGWGVGQGLRTGCNDFFYVERVASARTNAPVIVQFSHLLSHSLATVPSELAQLAIRRQSQLNGSLVPKRPNSLLLNLEGWFLPEDAAQLSKEARRTARVLPRELSAIIRRAADTVIKGRTTIPDLSAVKPNSRKVDGGLSRCWYQIPRLARRHRPDLLVPRVNNLSTSVRLNRSVPLVVDANFSGLWRESGPWCKHALVAYLTSTWGQLAMERAGTPMGGGALKLEAVQLRRLALPNLTPKQLASLSLVGRSHVERGASLLDDADKLLAGLIGGARSSLARAAFVQLIQRALRSEQGLRRRQRPQVFNYDSPR